MSWWRSEEMMRLIGLYEEEPVLWDPDHPRYEHKVMSSEAWERIRDVMGRRYGVEDLKREMSYLKQMYHQHKRENRILIKSDLNDYFRRLDPFLGKTSTYITTADSTQVQKIGDTEDVKVALDQTLRDITKDLATTKDDVKELTQQVVNLQLENNTLREEVQKIGDTEDIKVALDQKLRDIPKDLATKDDVKELTQQVVNLQLENNTLREEIQKIGDTGDVKVKDAGVPQQEDVCGLYAKLLAEKLRRLPERERHFRMLEIDGTFSRDFDVK